MSQQVCPNCGDWSVLVEKTGWCRACSNLPTEKESQHSIWQTRNRERIDYWMEQGYPRYLALKKVTEENRKVCANCGNPLKGAKSTSVVCRANTECRKVYTRIYYIHRTKGISLKEAYERFDANRNRPDR